MRFFILLSTFLICGFSFSQKTIDHTVYNDWKSIRNHKISADGNIVVYEINPHRGDGYLYINNLKNNTVDSIPRGSNPVISGNSNYIVFHIKPGFDTLRTCELDKIDKKKWPKDSLGIWHLDNDSLVKIAKVKDYYVNDESDWMIYISHENKIPEGKNEKKKKCLFRKKKNKVKELKSTGKAMFVLNPTINKEFAVKNVVGDKMSENGKFVVYTTQEKDDYDSVRIFVLNTEVGQHLQFGSAVSSIPRMNFNKNETRVVSLMSSDTSKAKNYRLTELNLENGTLSTLIDTTSSFFDSEEAVSKNFQPSYSKNDKYLYFGVTDKVRNEPKDTLLSKEKPKFDLWHYNDPVLQPEQLKRKKRDELKTDLYVMHLDSKNVVKLENDTLDVRIDSEGLSSHLLGFSKEQYVRTYNWEYPHVEDIYLVSIEDGGAELIQPRAMTNGNLSPSGNYYAFYDMDKREMFIRDNNSKEVTCMTCSREDIEWLVDMNGQPTDPYPYGELGWTRGEKEVWLQSEFDIWAYNINSQSLSSVTGELGKHDNIRLRAIPWSYDSLYIELGTGYVRGFNETTKGVHFYELHDHGNHVDMEETASFDASVGSIAIADNHSRMIFRKETFRDYPDLFIASKKFSNEEQITNANPQLGEYKLGTVELTSWTSNEGVELDGLIYKPDDFDSTKSYPLLIYYYELRSDNLHKHYSPRPTASIIYPGEYVSAGYVVLIPDIKYTPGYPARSAYDCIMSATDHVLAKYPNIDSTRMGLQGQSWGGYQTAQLITMTTRYKAAMAGAPVSNMFSAYGGIRWGSGLNRAFQYERTQSRIGATIWESPELYYENSPLFHLPNVETPLLIMHNDNDGAVPWYQGIELFTGMRRLGKEVYMLTYNGDGHNLMKNANRIDLSIRMRQFFDYYLQDQEAPQWLLDGIPATLKGKELRY